MSRRGWKAAELEDLATLDDEAHAAKWGRTVDAVRLARGRVSAETKSDQSVVAVMSDSHIGKHTDSFGIDIARTRLKAFGAALDDAQDRRGISRDSELVIAMLGDMVDGDGIYPTQAHHQEVSNVNEQANLWADMVTGFYEDRRKRWGSVRIEAVAGNHGRSGKGAHEAASWDIVTYDYMRRSLAGRVGVHFNDESGFFMRRVDVRGYPILLYHGHEIRSANGTLPINGLATRALRWANTKLAPFESVIAGHYHSYGEWQLNKLRLMFNGTLVTDDDYSVEKYGWESAPKWRLIGIDNAGWKWSEEVFLGCQ